MTNELQQLILAIMPKDQFGYLAKEIMVKPINQVTKAVKEARAYANKELHKLTGMTGREGIYHQATLDAMKVECPHLLPEITSYETIVVNADKYLKLVGKNAKGQNLIAQKVKAKGYVIEEAKPEVKAQAGLFTRKIKVRVSWNETTFFEMPPAQEAVYYSDMINSIKDNQFNLNYIKLA